MIEIDGGVMMDLKSGHHLQEIIVIIKPLVPDLIGEVTKDMVILLQTIPLSIIHLNLLGSQHKVKHDTIQALEKVISLQDTRANDMF